MKHTGVTLIVLILMATFKFAPVYAAPVPLDAETRGLKPGRSIEYIKAPRDHLNAGILLEKKSAPVWKISKSENPGFGHTSSTYWFRLNLKNREKSPHTYYLEEGIPHIDMMDVYVSSGPGRYKIQRAGDFLRLAEWPVNFHNPSFPFRLNGNQESQMLLRLQTSSGMLLALRIYAQNKFREYSREDPAFIWMYYGFILIMLLYNLFIFISVRDISYFYYILYLTCFGSVMYIQNGYMFRHVGADWIRFYHFCIPLAVGGASFSLIQFARHIIRMSEVSPLLDRLLFYIGLLGIVLVVPGVMEEFRLFSNVAVFYMAPLCGVFGFGTTVYISLSPRRRNRPAVFFTAAFTVFILGIILNVLRISGIAPVNFATLYGMQIGSALEIMLLSFALADRINSMRRELENLSHTLELKVQERTEELSSAMEEMEVLNDHLIDTNKDLREARRIAEIDLHMAANMQKVLFPQAPPRLDKWDIACEFRPMTGVSGDFYEFFLHQEQLAGLALCDVSGHGTASGLISMLARVVIHRSVEEEGARASLSKIVKKANTLLIRELRGAQNYITGIFLRVRGEEIDYINAGHPGLIIKQNELASGPAVIIPGESQNGPVLGVGGLNGPFKGQKLTLKSGDSLILFTDCLTESKNKHGEEYGQERLIHCLASLPQLSAAETLQLILQDFQGFLNRVPLKDDLTVLVLTRRG